MKKILLIITLFISSVSFACEDTINIKTISQFKYNFLNLKLDTIIPVELRYKMDYSEPNILFDLENKKQFIIYNFYIRKKYKK